MMMMKRCLINSQISVLDWVRRINTTTAPSSTNLSLLIAKLLRLPLSRIKETLDSEEIDQFSILKTQDFSWDAVVTALKQSSSPNKANLVVEWKLEKLIKENEKNLNSYSSLIFLCAKIQNVETAMRIFSSMEVRGLGPTSSVFNALISACLSSNNFVTAVSLYELMDFSEEYNCDSGTYNAFILAYANLGNKKAMQAWYSAKMAAGFSPDIQAYEALIMGCVKTKDFADAERLFEEMASAGFAPNLSILQNILLVYTGLKNFRKVRQYMMLALDSPSKISRYTAQKVVGLYYELGRMDEMEELLLGVTNSNQDSGILSLVHNTMIRLYVKVDRLDDVEYSIGRMMKQGISFSYAEDVEKVIRLYFQHAAYERLDLFLECIRDCYKFRRSTFDLLVAGYRRAGLQEKLDLVTNDMKKNGFVVS